MGDSGKLTFSDNLRRFRENLGMTQEQLGEAAEFDRSYIGGIERGERNPSLDAILRLASALRVAPGRLFEGIGDDTQAPAPDRSGAITALVNDDGLLIGFKYDQYDAEYQLSGATEKEFVRVLRALKDGLAFHRGRADAVANAFHLAVQTWPDANPSDLWTFLINRAYCDRSNHPIANARLNLEQSWKRTSGWALERVLIAHYQPFLESKGVTVKIAGKTEKAALLGNINDPRIVPDKADILVLHHYHGVEHLLGVVHVKASIAERRTDDVPMSRALIESGYLSVFWTMDAKSFPSAQPVNSGEFGDNSGEQTSDKRRDFEEHGHFSVCFSYNRNTMPTLDDRNAVSRIFVCDFRNPDDRFSQFLRDALRRRLAD